MGVPKRGFISTLSFLLVFLWANVSEGYFMHHSALDGFLEKDSVEKSSAADAGHKHDVGAAGNPDEVSREANEHKVEVKDKYPVIMAMHRRLARVFGKQAEVWYMDWKLSVGFIFWFGVWVKRVMCGKHEIYHETALFAFGINIMILHHLQYSDTIKSGMMGVMAFLTMQTLFHNYVWFSSQNPGSEKEFECDTLYLDLSLPVEQILILFVAQVCVWWFYMTSILNNFDFETVNYWFWLVSYLSLQMTMIFNRGEDSALGNPFPIHDVFRMVKGAGRSHYTLTDDDGAIDEATVPFTVSRSSVLFRGASGFFCNSILREIMSYTIPLMLMGFSEPMDFVVYCVGVNFICTLDDMSSKKYKITNPDLQAGDEEEPTKDEHEHHEAHHLRRSATGAHHEHHHEPTPAT